MIYVFSKQIDIDSVSEFITRIDEADNKEKIKIYFSTKGGTVSSANMMIDYINKYIKNRTTMVIAGDIDSAGFYIFLKTKCKYRILNSAQSLMHLNYFTTSTNDLKGDKLVIDSKTILDESNKRLLKLMRVLNLNIDKYDELLKGKDILLNYKELRQMKKKMKEL